MRERPILFSGEMVRAILAGTKTQTRRVAKPEHFPERRAPWDVTTSARTLAFNLALTMSPYGRIGNRLWVRETWAAHWMYNDVAPSKAKSGLPDDNYWFAADPDGTPGTHGCESRGRRGRWRPSIHMPRWASRITLEVADVRLERLQDISEEDAEAEGVSVLECIAPEQSLGDGTTFANGPHRGAYAALWDTLNFDRGFGWKTNPWVWVIIFKRLDAQEKAA